MFRQPLNCTQVEAVALNPDQTVYSENELPVAQSQVTLDDKTYLLRVVFRDEGDTRIVITAWITSQVKKYWQKE